MKMRNRSKLKLANIHGNAVYKEKKSCTILLSLKVEVSILIDHLYASTQLEFS